MTTETSAARDVPPERFLVGRSVYLRAPRIDQDVMLGNWHTWLSHQENTRHLVHGIRPLTREMQSDYVASVERDPSTLLLCIARMDNDEHVGAVTLRNIDLVNRVAEIGIVTAPGGRAGASGAFEAMALMLKHAFGRLNLDSLYAGQHQDLWKWINSLSLLGFRIEGMRLTAGRRDGSSYATFHTSVSAVEFDRLVKERGGDILAPSPLDLLRGRPRKNPTALIRAALTEANNAWLDKDLN